MLKIIFSKCFRRSHAWISGRRRY